MEQWRLFAATLHACARVTREPSAENIAALRAAIEAQHRSGAHVGDSAWIPRVVEASLAAGDLSGAEAALKDTFDFVERSGEQLWLADLHRLDGRIALKQPKPNRARAEASFLKAIDVARSQEARLLELRAATELARLWRDAGSRNDPCTLLAPILAQIDGGETTRDVRNARALLAEIA